MTLRNFARSPLSKLAIVSAFVALSACATPDTSVATVKTFEMATADITQVGDALVTDGRVIIRGITFDTNSAELSAAAYASTSRIGQVMDANPGLNLAVVGYTDDTGNFNSNLALSQRRAASVVAALKDDFGIAPERLAAVGAGELAAIADNASDFGRSQNRRVELVVIND